MKNPISSLPRAVYRTGTGFQRGWPDSFVAIGLLLVPLYFAWRVLHNPCAEARTRGVCR